VLSLRAITGIDTDCLFEGDFPMKDAWDYFSLPPAVPEQPYQSGCTLLWQAVLLDCFACRFDQSRAGRTQAQRDRDWVVSTSQAPYSFEWICHELGFDPQATRAAYLNGDPFTLGSPFVRRPLARRRYVWRSWIRESTQPMR
jgi:hypothetical protein